MNSHEIGDFVVLTHPAGTAAIIRPDGRLIRSDPGPRAMTGSLLPAAEWQHKAGSGSPALDTPTRPLPVAAWQLALEVLAPLAARATAQRKGAHGDEKIVIDQNLCRKAARALALMQEAQVRQHIALGLSSAAPVPPRTIETHAPRGSALLATKGND